MVLWSFTWKLEVKGVRKEVVKEEWSLIWVVFHQSFHSATKAYLQHAPKMVGPERPIT